MNVKSTKIYAAGFAAWMALVIVSIGIWRYAAFVTRLTVLSYDGIPAVIPIPDFNKVTVKQAGETVMSMGNSILNAYTGDVMPDGWFRIKGDPDITSPELRMPEGMADIVDWSIADDGELTVKIDMSEVKTPEVEIKYSSPALLVVPDMTRLTLAADPLPAVGTLTIEGMDVRDMRIETPYCRIDDCRFDSLTVAVAGGHTDMERSGLFMNTYMISVDKWSPLASVVMNGTATGTMRLLVPDSVESTTVRFSLSESMSGHRRQRRYAAYIGTLEVESTGCPDSTAVILSYDGMLPELIGFQTGITNTLWVTTENDYVVDRATNTK